jgi:hypothetical protein
MSGVLIFQGGPSVFAARSKNMVAMRERVLHGLFAQNPFNPAALSRAHLQMLAFSLPRGKPLELVTIGKEASLNHITG